MSTPASGPPPLGNRRADPGWVLLVENSEGIGYPVAARLRADGYLVSWQQTVGSALAEAERGRFDVVLVDVGLPDADGFELCRDLRLRQPSAALVLLGGRAGDMDVVVGLEAGADDFIAKPFELAALCDRVRLHVGARRGEVAGSVPG